MKEEDIFRELFSKAEFSFPQADLESIVLEKIRKRQFFERQKQKYRLAGKIGLGCFVVLCLLYLLLLSGNVPQRPDGMYYVVIGVPSLLLLGAIQLEAMMSRRPFSKQLPRSF